MRFRPLGLLLVQAILLSLWLVDRVSASMSLPDCPERCGNVTVPYPFGIGSSCSANSSFIVACRNSTNGAQIPFLTSINMEVLNISVRGTVTVIQPVSPLNCSETGSEMRFLVQSMSGSPFSVSPHYNTFVNLGCTNSVWLWANLSATVGGCMAICQQNTTDTSCNGVNCCQTVLLTSIKEVRYTYQMINQVSNRSTCGYAFIVDKTWLYGDYRMYRGLQGDLLNPFDQDFQYVPLVLDWEFTEQVRSPGHCRTYRDIDHDIFFDEYEYGSSTRQCYCPHGYEGNAYLVGCEDVDECRTGMHNCVNSTCVNQNGGFTCEVPTHTGNKSKVNVILIGVGSGFGALLLLIGAWRSNRVVRKRIKANRRQKFFKKNGGLLLEQQLISSEHCVEKTQLFGSKELEKATDNYNENRVLGGGGQGTVYKGMLTDGRIVAIKKSKRVHESYLGDFINEVVILSQINHRNVVKLLGCCLETEVPVLVYEFIPNGTLSQLIHDPGEELPLLWEMRLRIMAEVAGALSYLHSSASTPVYHRDIKSTNILLDDKYRAKVADFGTSRSISVDQTHLTTRVLGTFGYLDPEYFQSSQFTDKSDVYSFGVLMVELLTGEKAISSVREEVGRSLAAHFLHSMDENVLLDILDEQVLKEGMKEALFAAAEIAKRCLHLNGKKRPTMKEVAVELERIQMMKEGSVVKHRTEDKEFYTIDVSEDYDFSTVTGSMHFDTTTDSFDDHPLISQDDRIVKRISSLVKT